MTWNLYAAVDYLIKHAAPKSQHQCAKYVRLAIEAGGISTAGRPVSAYQYKDFLPKIGFKAIGSISGKNSQDKWTKNNARKGDIAVMDHGEHGHICMFSGYQWISDFKQNHMWVYGGDGTCYIFRFNGEIDPTLDAVPNLSSTGLVYTVPRESQDDNILFNQLANIRYNLINMIFPYFEKDEISVKSDILYENKLSMDDSSLSESIISTGMFWLDGGGDVFGVAGGDVPVLTSKQSKDNANKVIQALMKELGLTKEQAAGIAGVLTAESGVNPNIFNKGEKNGTYKSSSANNTGKPYGDKHCPWSYGAGICQWTFTQRKESALMGGLGISKEAAKNIIMKKGIELLSLDDQIKMLIYELKTTYKATLAGIKKCKTPESAAATYYCHAIAGFSTSTNPATQEEINKNNAKYAKVGATSQINKGMGYAKGLM